jgi:hypothetical protein
VNDSIQRILVAALIEEEVEEFFPACYACSCRVKLFAECMRNTGL